jgi:hypothetical protein
VVVAWAPDYVTDAELKSYLRDTSSADDALYALWATTASRAVDNYCHRQFGNVSAEAREYETAYWRHLCKHAAYIDDLQDVTGLEVLDSNGDEITDYTLGPVNALKKGKPYEWIQVSVSGPLTITAPWGWTAVPSAVKLASRLQGARFAVRRDSPFGVAGSPDQGNEMRLLAQLDPDLKTALAKYRREVWAA